MVLPVINNWLSDSLKENLNVQVNNLPFIVFLSIVVVVISAIFLEQLVTANKVIDNGKPKRNPPNPDNPLLMGLFVSSSFIINVIEIKCLPLSSILIPENLAQILLPLLLGGIFTGTLALERKNYLTAKEKIEKKSKTFKEQFIRQKITETLDKYGRVSQRQILEECMNNKVIINEFEIYMTMLSLIDDVAKTLSRDILNSVQDMFPSSSNKTKNITTNAKINSDAAMLQKKKQYYFEKYLGDLIVHTMVDYVRHHQSQPEQKNIYWLVANQPGMWRIQRA